MTKIPRFAEKGFVVSALLISSGAITRLRGLGPASMSDSLLQVIWFGIYVITLFLLFVLRNRAVKVVAVDKLSWVLVGIALCSTLWSPVAEITLRRSIALVGTNLFGIYLAARYNLDEQLRLLAWALGIAAILSLVVVIGIPSFAIESSGAWRGIYAQKNILARLMVVSSMVFLLLALSSHKHRWFVWVMFGLSVGLTVLSTSKTALVNLITLWLLLFFYRFLRLHYSLVVPLSIFGILAIAGTANVLSSNLEILLESLGKDATLSGRTDLWDSVLKMIWERPILGYGYGGFWITGWDGPAGYIWETVNWRPVHAHNGILNLWLDIGLLGVCVFVFGYLILIMRSLSWIRMTKTIEGFWPLMYMTFMLLYNQTESSLLGQNDFFWILYVAISFSKPPPHIQSRKVVYT